jgi:hypothetical protein
MRLYEIFETGKKQDLTPLRDKKCGLDESSPYRRASNVYLLFTFLTLPKKCSGS